MSFKLPKLKEIGWRRGLLLLAFLLTLGVAGIFVFRAVQPIVYWRLHRDEPIKGWMNVGYVAHSYHVPPPVLYQALGLPPRPRDRRPLREIAREQHRSMDEVRETLLDAIKQFRAGDRPPPPPPPPDAEGSP